MQTSQTVTSSHPYAQKGFSDVTPFLMVENADQTLAFVKEVFDAEEIFVLRQKDGKLWHAQIMIGDSMIMLADSMGKKEHTMPASLYLYVEDTDAFYKKALAAGASSIMEPADQFYGDRNAGVRDKSGNVWWLATKIEDISHEEMTRRGQEWEQKNSCSN